MVSEFIVFVFIGFMTSLIEQSCGQEISFPSVLTYEKKPNQVGNWSVNGVVKLTETDLIMFEPLLEVQTCSKMCTIDLSKCESEAEEPPSPNTCYCKRTSKDEMHVRIGALDKPDQNGLSLQAVLSSRAAFDPLKATRVIGTIPSMTDAILSFTKIPEYFQVGQTHNMSMRCDVQQSDDKFRSVMSLAIVRDGTEQVAKVSVSDPAKALADISSLKVEGNVSDKTTELDYIELFWDNPSEKLIGVYECVVDAVNYDGDDVTMTSILEVRRPAPTINELVNRMAELGKEIQTERTTRQRELEKEKESSKSELLQIKESTKTEIEQMKEVITELKTDNIAIKTQNVNILKDLASLQSQLTQNTSPGHVESGSANCDNSTQSSTYIRGLFKGVDYHVVIKFKKPYTKRPLVMQAISSLQLSGMQNSKGAVTIDTVDENGFTARCHTWTGTHVYYNMHFTWISISTDE